MQKLSFKTEIKIQPSENRIKYAHDILSVGSCFSVEIAQKLSHLQYRVLQNPAGITFNAISILTSLKRAISLNSLPENELNCKDNIWSHPEFHGSFNKASKEEYLLAVNEKLEETKGFLKQVRQVFITLGTAFVFEQKNILSNGTKVVNNCHKLSADLFERRLLSEQEILESLIEIKKLLDNTSENPVNIIITLSPVRHIRDGLIANQRSKAVCLSAIHRFVDQFQNVDYFPAYEIMLDELRDYRFYKRDLIHPSELAVDYIYNQFEEAFLAQDEVERRVEIESINRSLAHRAINPDSEAHKAFITQLEKRLESLSKH